MQRTIFSLLLTLYISAGSMAAFADDSDNSSSANTTPTPYTDTLDTGGSPTKFQYNQMMEQCKVVDADGNGLIKAYMADSGNNLEGDASAWIWVPYGDCSKLNAGDYDGISPDILAKINRSNVQTAPTLE